MRKGQDIIGKPVVAYDSGEKLETISDLIFDQGSNQLLGFLVDEGGWFSDAKVLPIGQVKAIGLDAVIVASKEAITTANNIPAIKQVLERNNILKGTRIMTLDGRDLGNMIDLYFDAQTGSVEGYEVSGGLFADAYSGRSFVPAPDTLKIGEDVAFVPSETADLMEEQVGGLKAAMQVAGEKLQETAQVAGEKLQETSRSATTALTNTMVAPAEQKAFVLGKVAQHTVNTPEGGILITEGEVVTSTIVESAENSQILGELYRVTGGSVTDKLGERVGNAVAGLTVEQTQGRRVQRIVHTSEGYVIAATGQIVTSDVIERAKHHHQEQALLDAVGLSNKEAAQSQTETLASSTGEYVKQGTKNLWKQVKETASDLQGRSTQAIDEQRIKGALGHPVTRVILDSNDGVILNVGDLITHQAIEMARQAEVLGILLDSV
ncbi:MAG: PRC-barrel domain-containing protein, partial [Microcoleaceae cyanobacterium]